VARLRFVVIRPSAKESTLPLLWKGADSQPVEGTRLGVSGPDAADRGEQYGDRHAAAPATASWAACPTEKHSMPTQDQPSEPRWLTVATVESPTARA
jgi:hypothetical protein